MTHKILSKKWRPQSFHEITGQHFVVKALKNSLILNKIHQAWIFYGTRGIGKTSLARILAKSLNCIKLSQGEPCKKCSHCKAIEKGNFIDLIEIDGASKTKVEDIKEILENIQYSPIQGLYKIYLIDEVHMLSKHSFHALLKTLEEPPKHVKFILATTDIKKVPETIISRCLSFSLKTLNETEIFCHIKNILKQENIEYEEKGIKIIAEQSKGSIRDALNILEQAIAIGNGKVNSIQIFQMFGIIENKIIFLITQSLLLRDFKYILNFIQKTKDFEINWKDLLINIMKTIHQIILIKHINHQEKKNDYDKYHKKKTIFNLANSCHMNQLHLYYRILIVGLKEIELAPTQKIGAEMTLLRILNIKNTIFYDTIQCYTKNLFDSSINNHKKNYSKI
ncbi:DNA polymerase III subunit gamma/tau [Buchnera aphidicola (Thelaxes californica)]|uniref:DNA polymerase III subunit gamma/tau n=1 Tax=Buchnera aphidicola (Thelaxes californica) TaxID=1315998 RepID=A0A4D6YJW4_9GAMM|nr:DNA polymerase III subunit gamma/tau [Buchnera aphidicola]QCI26891.1 DNA polymerase III subunit gamma/tau [Buchnera aphidicola (Thelaxes californica)]